MLKRAGIPSPTGQLAVSTPWAGLGVTMRVITFGWPSPRATYNRTPLPDAPHRPPLRPARRSRPRRPSKGQRGPAAPAKRARSKCTRSPQGKEGEPSQDLQRPRTIKTPMLPHLFLHTVHGHASARPSPRASSLWSADTCACCCYPGYSTSNHEQHWALSTRCIPPLCASLGIDRSSGVDRSSETRMFRCLGGCIKYRVLVN